MVIDPSAILAIMYAEPEESTFLELIASNEICLLSAPGYVELSIVLGTRYGAEGREYLDRLLQELKCDRTT
ncbi:MULTISPECIES: type II toxin-antitoxin system VapC family toxin [unclassified Roseofilum]|uniref:type II toxin-antitoxin system VapC family toxin n=1 Tax=unclassified Roseofilum TaxID=2620099 RepID=UPI001B1EB5BF|nr:MULTISPECIES: type II toxin-antitoxin system VapC family toxin [unclassified Roseofilum]MBP0011373.1 type II toxin-antitoxin system VapC family toxin [Roseofilum sp. Belize Diploria]MBP0036003.1 type II toxin-antitoxin system VapC family toxin [Roseofilum sp. Belize BBD 4]